MGKNKLHLGTDFVGTVLVAIATFLLLSLFWEDQYSMWIYRSGTIIGVILLFILSIGIFHNGK